MVWNASTLWAETSEGRTHEMWLQNLQRVGSTSGMNPQPKLRRLLRMPERQQSVTPILNRIQRQKLVKSPVMKRSKTVPVSSYSDSSSPGSSPERQRRPQSVERHQKGDGDETTFLTATAETTSVDHPGTPPKATASSSAVLPPVGGKESVAELGEFDEDEELEEDQGDGEENAGGPSDVEQNLRPTSSASSKKPDFASLPPILQRTNTEISMIRKKRISEQRVHRLDEIKKRNNANHEHTLEVKRRAEEKIRKKEEAAAQNLERKARRFLDEIDRCADDDERNALRAKRFSYLLQHALLVKFVRMVWIKTRLCES